MDDESTDILYKIADRDRYRFLSILKIQDARFIAIITVSALLISVIVRLNIMGSASTYIKLGAVIPVAIPLLIASYALTAGRYKLREDPEIKGMLVKYKKLDRKKHPTPLQLKQELLEGFAKAIRKNQEALESRGELLNWSIWLLLPSVIIVLVLLIY